MISMLSLFECITYSSSLSLEEIKSVAIVIWILHALDLLKLLLIFFKYVLILLIYSSTDSFFFCHRYFHNQHNYCSKDYLFLVLCNNLLFMSSCPKRFLISLIVIFLITLFFIFGLKRFLISLTVVPSISFFNRKRFLTSLIVVSSISFF